MYVHAERPGSLKRSMDGGMEAFSPPAMKAVHALYGVRYLDRTSACRTSLILPSLVQFEFQ